MMALSKNWNSRKAVISKSHLPVLQQIAESTGLESLSEAVNFLIADYRKQQKSPVPDTEKNDDFGIEIGEDLL
ncbi:MAG: hypothetical protein QNJ68_07895 [Microcoleaceae cyanobacterium MO_207.B10]|nr:hypothetical protein [Microcoleaceae cyanobacterium MO_207.B10]